MESQFYYKEEFPLELRITINNINELRYLRYLHSIQSSHVINRATLTLGVPGIDDFKNYVEEFKNNNGKEDPDGGIFKDLRDLLDEYEKREKDKNEGRDVLSGDVS